MRLLISALLIALMFFKGTAQELESILEQETDETSFNVPATFKGTRIANGHSVETRKKGVGEFLITHRFGRINSGFYDLFGLDEANIRLAFEYAITDDLTVALGRSSFEKTYDVYVKYRLLHQKTGEKPFPISLTLFGSAALVTLKDYYGIDDMNFSERLAYTSQVLIARKFSPSFSLQLTPSFVHLNTVPTADDPNNMFALGFGTRIKISKRMAFNGEYYYNFNKFQSFETFDSIALGVEFETGGHIFQLVFTNSRPMIEKGFITQTTGDFFNGDIHFGFNISRAFQIKKTNNNDTLY